VVARLVTPDGERVLFSDFVIYNNVFGQAQAITIDPSDAHRYPDYDDLEAAWPQAIAGRRKLLRRLRARRRSAARPGRPGEPADRTLRPDDA
jgi:hypothetical protein